jgi:hypothetical protein
MHARIMFKKLFVAALFAFSAPQIFSVSQAWAAGCVQPSASVQVIGGFKANPQGLITPNSDTRTVEATVRELAGTDASLAADLVRLAQGASPRFQTAIAAGLAQAAIACTNVDQQAALTIQQAVAGFQDGQFQASFAAVAGDLSTAATDAATSFANGSVGSVVIINPNASLTSTFTPGGGGTLPSPGIFALFTAGPTNAPATPVSPTR